MIDASALQPLLAILIGWVDREEWEVLRHLIEENRPTPLEADSTVGRSMPVAMPVDGRKALRGATTTGNSREPNSRTIEEHNRPNTG